LFLFNSLSAQELTMKVLINDKVWDKEAVQALIDRNDQAVARALLVIYQNQTDDEQASFSTRHQNGVGFTGNDAEWLTDIAVKWKKWGRWASPKQCNAVRRAIRKYHRQLLEHMLATHPGARRIDAREARALTPAERFAQGLAA
jgi:hypothetical protein